MVNERAGDLDDLGAERLQQLDGLVEAGQHARLVSVAAELLDHADAQPRHVGRCAPPRPPAGTGASMEVESIASCPENASCSSAASITLRAKGPGVSSELAKAIRP